MVYEETCVSINTITMVLKSGVKNNPGTNSVLFQCVIEINFQPGLIMCAMLYNVNTVSNWSKMKKKKCISTWAEINV